MTLYIKQKVFTLTDRYSIYNESEEPVFNVEKQLFSFPSKFYLFDNEQNELFRLEKNFTLFLSSYEIYCGNKHYASVQKELSLFKAKFLITSEYGEYVIDGAIFDYDFSIFKNGELMGTVNKKLLSWGDSYELQVKDTENAAFFCALVIAIDNCLHNENK